MKRTTTSLFVLAALLCSVTTHADGPDPQITAATVRAAQQEADLWGFRYEHLDLDFGYRHAFKNEIAEAGFVFHHEPFNIGVAEWGQDWLDVGLTARFMNMDRNIFLGHSLGHIDLGLGYSGAVNQGNHLGSAWVGGDAVNVGVDAWGNHWINANITFRILRE